MAAAAEGADGHAKGQASLASQASTKLLLQQLGLSPQQAAAAAAAAAAATSSPAGVAAGVGGGGPALFGMLQPSGQVALLANWQQMPSAGGLDMQQLQQQQWAVNNAALLAAHLGQQQQQQGQAHGLSQQQLQQLQHHQLQQQLGFLSYFAASQDAAANAAAAAVAAAAKHHKHHQDHTQGATGQQPAHSLQASQHSAGNDCGDAQQLLHLMQQLEDPAEDSKSKLGPPATATEQALLSDASSLINKLSASLCHEVQQHLLQLAQDQIHQEKLALKSAGDAAAAAAAKQELHDSTPSEDVVEAVNICWHHSLRVLLSNPGQPWNRGRHGAGTSQQQAQSHSGSREKGATHHTPTGHHGSHATAAAAAAAAHHGRKGSSEKAHGGHKSHAGSTAAGAGGHGGGKAAVNAAAAAAAAGMGHLPAAFALQGLLPGLVGAGANLGVWQRGGYVGHQGLLAQPAFQQALQLQQALAGGQLGLQYPAAVALQQQQQQQAAAVAAAMAAAQQQQQKQQ
jgi:hypothetical protein